MATHTESGKGSYGRKFSISRENGQVDKNGRPYFFEWIKEVPAETGKRKFETRKNTRGEHNFYELFAALDGYLIDIRTEKKDLGNGDETWLVLHLIDADEEYVIEVGRMESRYTTDVLKRLLNPAFNPNYKVRFSPFAMEDDEGKPNIGISTFSGVDKLTYSQASEFLKGIEQPRTWLGKNNKTEYDFTPVGEWLFEQAVTWVLPKLMKDPVSAPQKQPVPKVEEIDQSAGKHQNAAFDNPFPNEENAPANTDDDDSQLPF